MVIEMMGMLVVVTVAGVYDRVMRRGVTRDLPSSLEMGEVEWI